MRLASWTNKSFLLLAFCSTVLPLLVSAQVLPNPHVKFSRLDVVLKFNSLGQLVSEFIYEREALTDQGAQALTKDIAGFNSALEQLELVEAYTLKKSGDKRIVMADTVVVQKGMVSAGLGVTMPEWQVKEWLFPSVSVGDRVVSKLRRTTNKAPLIGWMSAHSQIGPNVDFDSIRWRIQAPDTMNLQVSSSLKLDVSTTQAGLSVWEYSLSQKGRATDVSPANTRLAVPHIFASTIADYDSIAKLFAQEVIRKAVPNDALKQLVSKITQGALTPEAKARALYDWVRKEIKYVAVFLANAGWEPHDIAHILDKRYGDCKDHVTLLHAMLALAGVQSQVVLINTLNEYALDPLPTASYFNHTILYLPAFKRYIDPTASTIPFDNIPMYASGKPVLVSDGATAFIGRVPVITAADNSLTARTVLEIAANGSAKGTVDIDAVGFAASQVQDQLKQIPAGFAGVAMAQILRNSGLQGAGFLTFPLVNTDVQKQTVHAEFEVRNLLRDPTGGAVLAHPRVKLPFYIVDNLGPHDTDSREFGLVCHSMRMREEIDISFDPKFKLSRLPVDVDLQQEGIRFLAKYRFENNRLQGERELLVAHDTQDCSPAEYKRRLPILSGIARHVETPILYAQ